MNFRKIDQQVVFTAFVVLIAVVVSSLVTAKLVNNDQPASGGQNSTKDYPSIEFSRPNEWRSAFIGQSEKDSGIIARFARQNPSAELYIRSRSGTTAPGIDLEQTANDIAASLDSQVQRSTIISKGVIKIDQTSAIKIAYDQQVEDKVVVHRQLFVLVLAKKRYFLYYSSEEVKLSKIQKQIDELNQNFVKKLKTTNEL